MEELGYGGPLTRVTYENTYITNPEGYGPGTKFERHKVKEVLDEMLTSRLQSQQYDPVKSSQISKMLADDLREKVCPWRRVKDDRNSLSWRGH
jgi:tctex1 domain-containing protein 2